MPTFFPASALHLVRHLWWLNISRKLQMKTSMLILIIVSILVLLIVASICAQGKKLSLRKIHYKRQPSPYRKKINKEKASNLLAIITGLCIFLGMLIGYLILEKDTMGPLQAFFQFLLDFLRSTFWFWLDWLWLGAMLQKHITLQLNRLILQNRIKNYTELGSTQIMMISGLLKGLYTAIGNIRKTLIR